MQVDLGVVFVVNPHHTVSKQSSIYTSLNNGPSFGCGDFHIVDKGNTRSNMGNIYCGYMYGVGVDHDIA
jgi:hypothetical protein